MTNLKISALIVAATTAFAAPAMASGLAESLGVEPGVYTQSQLIQLQSAIEDDNVIRENFIRSQAGVVASAAERMAPGFVSRKRRTPRVIRHTATPNNPPRKSFAGALGRARDRLLLVGKRDLAPNYFKSTIFIYR